MNTESAKAPNPETETPVQSSNVRAREAAKQLFCGGLAGSVAKTATAPFSRLSILFQVHSMVTTKEHRPKFALTLQEGVHKIIERGGLRSLWKGNMTSVLHRFPYSAINFYAYESTLDLLSVSDCRYEETNETNSALMRRVSNLVLDENHRRKETPRHQRNRCEETPALHKFIAGAVAGTVACTACYPLDLVRTRLTTELEGQEHYRGIVDAFRKIARHEGPLGFYSGIFPTLLVAVPNFAISYTVYGTMKEYTLNDDLFYNLRRINTDSGEPKLGFMLTILCGAASGTLATLLTFPMDTIRRRMQIQSLHVSSISQKSSPQLFYDLVSREGFGALYRGLTPELLKVIPMVGVMFSVYEWAKETLNVRHARNS